MNIIEKKTKLIEIDGRRFQINKFTAFVGLKIAKMFVSKILPVFQSFLPMISKAIKGDKKSIEQLLDEVSSELDKYLNFEGISRALDMVSPDDLDYIMKNALMCCYEILPAGNAQVMNADGTYGVQNIEHDMLLVLRLVCEAVMWGVADFFEEDRLISIMSPLFSLLQPNQ